MAEGDGSTRRALVVEDQAMIALVAVDVLEDEGFDTVAVPSLAQARAALERGRFDVVVLDSGLPDGDGFDLVHDVARTNPEAHVFLASGRTPDGLPSEVRVTNLPKPYDPDTLASLTRRPPTPTP